MTSWIATSTSAAHMVLMSALGIYLSLLLLTRLVGLRSFAKISSFDFAITVAIGPLIASTIIAEDPPLAQAAVEPGGPKLDAELLRGVGGARIP